MSMRVTRWAGIILLAIAVPAVAQSAAQSFDSAGVPISYVDKGRGTPVVLIHGFTGSYARHWESPGVMQALETAGYRVIAMDCRGHGQSGKPLDPAQYGFEMVRDVLRLLDHLKIDRAHVVGYSLGGAIATQLLVGHPARLRTVTVLGAGWEGEDLTTFRSQILAMADGFARRDVSGLFRAVSGSKEPTPEELAAANESMFSRNDPEVLAAAARGMLPLWDVSAERLKAATLPCWASSASSTTWRRSSGWRRSCAGWKW